MHDYYTLARAFVRTRSRTYCGVLVPSSSISLSLSVPSLPPSLRPSSPLLSSPHSLSTGGRIGGDAPAERVFPAVGFRLRIGGEEEDEGHRSDSVTDPFIRCDFFFFFPTASLGAPASLLSLVTWRRSKAPCKKKKNSRGDLTERRCLDLNPVTLK